MKSSQNDCLSLIILVIGLIGMVGVCIYEKEQLKEELKAAKQTIVDLNKTINYNYDELCTFKKGE